LCALPIPGALRLPDTIGASFAATGRGWRHPTFTCRRPAPGRRAGWPEIQGHGFDEEFRRKWEFYLAYCEAGFLAGYLDVAQIRLERPAA
jgi:cyclopropane-fatty-acyl-phospholipid synthase